MSDLDLDFAQHITGPDEDAREGARRRFALLYPPPDAFGRLTDLAGWVAGAQGADPPRPLRDPRVVVVAADHGVAEAGVSAYPPAATAAFVRAVLDGGAPVSVLARATGVAVHVHDVGVDDDLADVPEDVRRHKIRRGSGRLDRGEALSPDESAAAFQAGMAIADRHIDEGADLLVLAGLGVGSSTPAAVLVAAVTGGDAAGVTGRGSGIDDTTWMRKCAAVRDGLRRARPQLGDPVRLLGSVGGAGFAAMGGFLLQAAARRTPVLFDGFAPATCAMVAQRTAPLAAGWWLPAAAAKESAHTKALERLVLEPVVREPITTEDGFAGVLAVQELRAAVLVAAEVATATVVGLGPTTGPAGAADLIT